VIVRNPLDVDFEPLFGKFDKSLFGMYRLLVKKDRILKFTKFEKTKPSASLFFQKIHEGPKKQHLIKKVQKMLFLVMN